MNEQQREQAINDIDRATNLSLAYIEQADGRTLRITLGLPEDASMEQIEDRICEIGHLRIEAIRSQAE